jgi:phosphate starvation-inducible PhoH-like protein
MLTSLLMRYNTTALSVQNKNLKKTDSLKKTDHFDGQGFKSTPNQDKFIESLNNKRIVIAHGPAGTGKTMLACNYAIQELNTSQFKKVLITRPAVAVDEEHGYLPGDLNQKMHPWMIPIYDNFNMFTTKSNLDYLLKSGKIEIVPLSFIRGRTFHDALIIADEMQNSTHNQMKTLLTRIGLNSTLVITGDLDQCDLNIDEQNGLLDFITRFQNYKITNSITDDDFIDVIKLDKSDIQRSEAVAHVLDIYDGI